MPYFIGIDFGTTTSCIAYTTEKSTMNPELIEIDGKKIINTAIRLTADGKEVESFGDEAWEGYQEELNRTFVEFKMDVGLGKKYDREGFSITPEEVGILFLRSLREKLERQFGRMSLSDLDAKTGVTTVIGYPAEWSKAQKAAVEEMAKQAGFPNVEGGVEPVGAIYYHNLNGEIPLLDAEQKVFVYDFGGGTSDIAIVVMSASTPPHVYDFDGLANLGGRNYDEVIIEKVFKPIFNCEHYSPTDLAEFQRKAQSLKERLSNKIKDGSDRVDVHLSGLNCLSGASRTVSLTKNEFEEVEKSLVEHFLTPIESSLQQTRFSANEIKFVIASGGSSRLYFVDSLLQKMFPHSSYLRSNSPQEVIAKGLAIFASRTEKNLRKAVHQAEYEPIIDVEADLECLKNDDKREATPSPENGKTKQKSTASFDIDSLPFSKNRKKIRRVIKLIVIGMIILPVLLKLTESENKNPHPATETRISKFPFPSTDTIKNWAYGLRVVVEKGVFLDDTWIIENGEIIRADVTDVRDMGSGLYCADVNVSARSGSNGIDVKITFEYGLLQSDNLLLNNCWYDGTSVRKIGNW